MPNGVSTYDLAAFAFGALVGIVGTMVGVGGGFLIVPAAALLQPGWSARTITAYSLAVVCANAVSGTAAYLRQRRIDLRSAALFAAAALPGVFVGVFGSNVLARASFDLLFGIILLAMAAFLAFAPDRRRGTRQGNVVRQLTDRDGNTYAWSFDMRLAVAGSALVGLVSSLFGIGGGPIQVPFLISLLNYPEHVATATSHAVLAITSIVATTIHFAQGDYASDGVLTVATAAGALVGAPIGARISRFIPGRVLVRILAGMLAALALRMIGGALRGAKE